ncbi:uncharacterized protein A4U43_C07F24900 [Asparagus officinalis]|uniref:Cytochrome c oxidase subunit n=1 Tax=Asparagus officinalis TaxID=4686 RepID=A0A5P1EJW8_ASPOF|nr:cytochrome c oxidase subunit 6b-1-like [Asparagus officinalis]ONK64350.1 uncharacterized protein A4U43_C07F24900 [Asparagus officinalis]
MAESDQQKAPSLAEEWSLPQNEQEPVQNEAPIEKAAEDEKPAEIASDAIVEDKVDEGPAAEENTPVAEESNETPEEEVAEVVESEEATEEQPEIKIETAPADFRFPTTNQTRHCFTRYVEYHKCIAAKGEDAPECNKFAKYYRSLCPGEWVDRWNEQRENGTFPGPL